MSTVFGNYFCFNKGNNICGLETKSFALGWPFCPFPQFTALCSQLNTGVWLASLHISFKLLYFFPKVWKLALCFRGSWDAGRRTGVCYQRKCFKRCHSPPCCLFFHSLVTALIGSGESCPVWRQGHCPPTPGNWKPPPGCSWSTHAPTESLLHLHSWSAGCIRLLTTQPCFIHFPKAQPSQSPLSSASPGLSWILLLIWDLPPLGVLLNHQYLHSQKTHPRARNCQILPPISASPSYTDIPGPDSHLFLTELLQWEAIDDELINPPLV